MPDRYALTPDAPATERPARPHGSPLRGLLWALLVLSIAGNTLTSFGVVPLAVTLAFGLVTGVTAISLFSLYVRRQR